MKIGKIGKKDAGKIRMMKTLLSVGLVILLATSASAVVVVSYLQTSYGTIETTANVESAILIDSGMTPITHSFDVIGGCTKMVKHKILNQACIEAPMDFYTPTNNAVDVEYYILEGWRTERLENKNPDTWEILDDEYWVEYTYNPCCPSFKFNFVDGSRVPLALTEYKLVYYEDQEDRFNDWDGYVLVLGTVTSDANGYLSTAPQPYTPAIPCWSTDIHICLPHCDDWNIGPDADYTQAPDNYAHGKGAKIWLVPSADLSLTGNSGSFITWNPTTYMFETDLIVYADCDINPVSSCIIDWFDYETPLPGTTVIPPGTEVCLFIKYIFAINSISYTTTFTTDIIPVVN